MRIPNKFNGYFADGRRLYNDPATAAVVGANVAGTGATTLAAGTVGAGLGSLGTGLATGASLAGGAGIFSNFMAGAAPALTSGLGASAAPIMASVAPAATTQAASTIAPSIIQSTGLEALKGKVIGAGVQNAAAQQATNLAFQNTAAQNMAGGLAKFAPQAAGYNPAIAQNLAPKFLANSPPIADPNNPLLRSSLAEAKPYITHNSVISDAPAKVAPELVNTTVRSPYDLSTGFKTGLNQNYQSLLKPGTNTVSETGQLLSDPRSEILGRSIRPDQNFLQNLGNISSFQDVKDYANQHPYATAGMAGLAAKKLFEQPSVKKPEDNAMIRPYTYDRTQRPEAYAVSPAQDSSERLYFNDQFVAGEPYKAAGGGIVSLAVGGPVEQMAAMNSVGANTGYPMANLQTPMYSNPAMQRPEATNVIAPSADAGVGAYTGEARFMAGGITTTTRSKEPETTGGYKYSYNPNTMQFTQTGGPGAAKPPSPEIAAFDMMKRFNKSQATGQPYDFTPSWAQGASTPNSTVSSGMATPVMQPTSPAQPLIPNIDIPAYQTPEQQLGLGGFYNMMNQQLGGYGGYAAGGGVSTLGDYSDGGRLLRGPGDGVSDSIPASIGNRQPARLADGEFVVPARIVSELGNGSTEAGARKLYAMMDRVQKGRRKSVGKGKVAVNSKADKYLPA